MNYENEMEKAKKELINLFTKLTITHKQEVNKLFLIQKRKKLNEKTIIDLINLIRDTIDMIISLKVNKMTENIINNNSNEEYEILLRQVESELRRHIGIQNHLKVQIEKMQLDAINNECVSLFFIFNF